MRTQPGRTLRACVAVEIMVGSFDPPGARLLDLVTVMDTLRRECPWDREQTHESLVRYLVEEAYETIEAIESGDRDHLARGARRPAAAGAVPRPDRGRGHRTRRSTSTTSPARSSRSWSAAIPTCSPTSRCARRRTSNDNWETIKAAEKGRDVGRRRHPAGTARAEPGRQGDRPDAQVGRSQRLACRARPRRRTPRRRSARCCSRWSRPRAPAGSTRSRRCAHAYASRSTRSAPRRDHPDLRDGRDARTPRTRATAVRRLPARPLREDPTRLGSGGAALPERDEPASTRRSG